MVTQNGFKKQLRHLHLRWMYNRRRTLGLVPSPACGGGLGEGAMHKDFVAVHPLPIPPP